MFHRTRRFPFAVAVTLILAPALAAADDASERAAGRLLRERMKTQSPEDLAILESVGGKDIVVVRGSMDHIETVLAAAGLPHTVIDPQQVAAADLMADQIVMVNCPGDIPAAGVRRIAKFVRAGGLLYTTDWSLANLVQTAFPGMIRHNGQSTGSHVTPVQVDAHHDDLMSNMLLRDDGTPQWWLEGGSYPIQILNRKKVQVLASSRQMAKQYGAAPVVVRFRWEDGEVIHVVSHFYRQVETRGPQVASKNAIDGVEGLDEGQKQAFKASADGDVRMKELESSYAFQQMTANLVTGKQRDNRVLDRSYGFENSSPLELEGRALPVGTRVKVLQRRNNEMRVRDDRGNEGWVDAKELQER
jgi:hypothetical protein